MKQIRLKDRVLDVPGCKKCPVRYNDGADWEDIPACGLVETDNDVIIYAKENRGDHPPWYPLEDKQEEQ